MIADTNNVVGLGANLLGGLFGSDSMILLGILLFLALGVAMIYARVKAGTAVMIGCCLAIMLSFVATEFAFLFWIAIVVSLIVLINGLRKMWIGY